MVDLKPCHRTHRTKVWKTIKTTVEPCTKHHDLSDAISNRLCRRLGGFERWRKFAHQELGNLHTMPWQWQEMEFWRALRLVAATVAKSELPTDPRRAACGLDGQTPSRGITPYTPQSGWVCTVASIFNIFSIQRLVVAAVFARGSASGHQQSVAQRFPPGPRGPWRLPI